MKQPPADKYQPAPATRLRRVLHFFGNLPARDWGRIAVKFLVVMWIVRYLVNVPAAMSDSLGSILAPVFDVAACGGIVAIIAIFISAQPTERCQRNGPVIEVAGLLMLMAAPLVFASTQLWIVIQNTVPEAAIHESPVWLGLAITAIFADRIVEIFPRYKRSSRRNQ